jgi:hypothetical protein
MFAHFTVEPSPTFDFTVSVHFNGHVRTFADIFIHIHVFRPCTEQFAGCCFGTDGFFFRCFAIPGALKVGLRIVLVVFKIF